MMKASSKEIKRWMNGSWALAKVMPLQAQTTTKIRLLLWHRNVFLSKSRSNRTNSKDQFSLAYPVMRRMAAKMTMIGCSKPSPALKSRDMEITVAIPGNSLIKTIIGTTILMEDLVAAMTTIQTVRLLKCQQI
jgi:hypothetical protein